MSTPCRCVLLAGPLGYCADVERAVRTVEEALQRFGPCVCVRQQIVHNAHVVRTLERKGAVFVEQAEEVPEGATVVFSAHGVAPTVRTDAARRLTVIDATCPLVTKVHKEARRYADEGYDILLIGHESHEEVIGTLGEAPDRIQLVDGPGAAAGLRVRDEGKVAWLSQTTLSVDETIATAAALRQRFPRLSGPPSDDICCAAQNRQEAVKQIAPDAGPVLVVGSPNSSNSPRLVEVSLVAGARDVHLVDNADEIDETWLEGVTTVGVTSGASVPEVLVGGVLDWPAERGFDQVDVVRSTEETQHFALPRPVAPDNAAARPAPRPERPMARRLLAPEPVTAGRPDRITDRIGDAVLDMLLYEGSLVAGGEATLRDLYPSTASSMS